jgi:peptidoglycan/xylan/chitin deacetylase (PgdA/CDA1 family)
MWTPTTVARPILERLGYTATVFLITSRDGRDPMQTIPTLAARPLLDLRQARAMLGLAMRFGAHTQTHPDLTTLEPAALQEEVLGSKRELERALEAPVEDFAYPFGEATQPVRGVVERAGFRSAAGVTPGHNRPTTSSFDLRRVEVRGTYTLLRFAATLLLGDTSGIGLRRTGA